MDTVHSIIPLLIYTLKGVFNNIPKNLRMSKILTFLCL